MADSDIVRKDAEADIADALEDYAM